ncbi:hypothetical protein SLE2022_008300 [Rubroshorea leprosula]
MESLSPEPPPAALAAILPPPTPPPPDILAPADPTPPTFPPAPASPSGRLPSEKKKRNVRVVCDMLKCRGSIFLV